MKTLYIIAGANGSGKTTFARSFASLHGLHFINADEIAASLDPEHITRYQIRAGRIFFERLDAQLHSGESFAIETTLAGKYLIKYIHQAHQLGYEVTLIYLFLENPQAHIERVAIRVLSGGHSVPREDIVRRFYRSREMFLSVYSDLVDWWEIYYNADKSFEKIADKNSICDEIKMESFKRINA